MVSKVDKRWGVTLRYRHQKVDKRWGLMLRRDGA